MATVTFTGIAPIPAGTNVRLLVDNPDKPTKAISIDDIDHKISYSSAAPTRFAPRVAPANFVKAVVVSVQILVISGQTTLNLSGVSPD